MPGIINMARSMKNKHSLSHFTARMSDSSLAILGEFFKISESKDFKIYFATNDKKRDQKFIDSIGLKVELVDIADFKYVKVLATSKYLINNSSFPAYFIRRDEQVYLQTWHGTPLKTLGKRMRFGIESMYNVQHNFLHANYIMFPNEFTRKAIMEDYNLEALYTGIVVMNGYPRNSIFMDHEKADQVTKKLGNEDYTTMAYMPTWRGQSNHDVNTSEYSREINQLLHYLDENLKDDQKLYVNFHPIVQKFVKLDNYEHIYPFPSGVDKYEFLNSVDALITDYSSVFLVLHTFGRDLKWNPHIHCLISEGDYSDDAFWRNVSHFNYTFLRNAFRTALLKEMLLRIGPSFKKVSARCYLEHKHGFYVYAKPNRCDPKTVTKYIGRYLGRPVIATSRVDSYTGDLVSFHYNRHEDDQYVQETIPVMDFIKRLIRHIPEKHFKMIRYGGLYARHRSIDKKLHLAISKEKRHTFRCFNRWRTAILSSFGYDPLICPHCKQQMVILEIYHNHRRVPLEELYEKAMSRSRGKRSSA